MNVERFPVCIFTTARICSTLFINEQEIPTNGVLDAFYPYLGERLDFPSQHMVILVHITPIDVA